MKQHNANNIEEASEEIQSLFKTMFKHLTDVVYALSKNEDKHTVTVLELALNCIYAHYTATICHSNNLDRKVFIEDCCHKLLKNYYDALECFDSKDQGESDDK